MVKPRIVMPRPCDNCPFRTDVLGGGNYLHPRRAADIAQALRRGLPFVCHKTTEDDDDGVRRSTARSAHCAGAAIVLAREGLPNQTMQVATRLGMWEPPQDPHRVVAESLDAFVAHHSPPDVRHKKESHARSPVE